MARTTGARSTRSTWLARPPGIPDVVLFLNGLPLVVIELKGTEGADLPAASTRSRPTAPTSPTSSATTLLSVISDGFNARFGSSQRRSGPLHDVADGGRRNAGTRDLGPGAAYPRPTAFCPAAPFCRCCAGSSCSRMTATERSRRSPATTSSTPCERASEAIQTARGRDGKAGVIWHTQGSGKSLLMAFLAGRVMHDPAMENPTLVVLTDRNDLDNQLFATFSPLHRLFSARPGPGGQTSPICGSCCGAQVGGIIFTTIQKFRPETGERLPELTDRSNVVVIVDEAHRTQYGFEAKLDRDDR